MNRWLNSLVGFCIAVLLFSCSVEKKAIKAFELGKYQNVIQLYKGTLAKQPSNGKANYFVAESYRLSNRIKESEKFYERAKAQALTQTVCFFITVNH